MSAPVLIFAVGNESRGDDAVAPLLLRRLQAAGVTEQCELVEEFQLQVENTLDMVGRELVLLIDAGMETPAPFAFYRAAASSVANLYSHALSPEALLTLYQQVHQQPAPPLFVLCVCGEQFELGAGLSAAAAGRMNQAQEFVQKLLRQAELAAWEACEENEKCFHA
ncbi:MAG TPA: hydrogenase maturation protease [Gallionellaceae bacterium]|nr:hydrogenase maturation protease [Gallionellaceae bacterium]